MFMLKDILHKSSFLFFLGKRYLKNFAKILAQVKKYANIKKEMALHKKSSYSKP